MQIAAAPAAAPKLPLTLPHTLPSTLPPTLLLTLQSTLPLRLPLTLPHTRNHPRCRPSDHPRYRTPPDSPQEGAVAPEAAQWSRKGPGASQLACLHVLFVEGGNEERSKNVERTDLEEPTSWSGAT